MFVYHSDISASFGGQLEDTPVDESIEENFFHADHFDDFLGFSVG